METGPLNIILDIFGLSPVGNNVTPEIQPSSQQNLRSEGFRKNSRWIQQSKVIAGNFLCVILDKMEYFYPEEIKMTILYVY
ncbi:unnamed protein product [Hymenolepis diminuta]|uniref:Uncharacterized protein n=1 Tax=Hymenolepis diminuta TaxID=6216 RepID=A0A564XVU4_HYMDI|nr:unnamed protein product [Hymenolepis diminuta]